MNPIRVFAIQGCKISKPIGEPGGGSPSLTPEDAAQYCRGMPDHWYYAAMLRWADNWAGASSLEYRLWDEAVKLKNRERWRIDKKYQGQEMLRKLAGLAIWEMGEPGRFKKAESWQLKAARLGVDKQGWYRTWKPRYEAVHSILSEWANNGYRHVKDAS